MKYKVYALLGFVCVCLFVFMFVSVFFIYFSGPNASSQHLQYFGQVGDFFGGMLNPILAFASFIALLYTIRIQSEELRLTTKELANNVEVQKDIVEQHKINLATNKANNKIGFVSEILRSKIKEADEILLKQEGKFGDYLVVPTLLSMYQAAYKNASPAARLEDEPELKTCSSVMTVFQIYINNNQQTYSEAFDFSLNVLQRILSTSDYYLQQLSDDSDIDVFYLNALKVELQRPAAILYLAGRVKWGEYRQINMAPFMDGQFITGYPTA